MILIDFECVSVQSEYIVKILGTNSYIKGTTRSKNEYYHKVNSFDRTYHIFSRTTRLTFRSDSEVGTKGHNFTSFDTGSI